MKLRRASFVIGGIASIIFVMSVCMVAVTLHFSDDMEKFQKTPGNDGKKTTFLLYFLQK